MTTLGDLYAINDDVEVMAVINDLASDGGHCRHQPPLRSRRMMWQTIRDLVAGGVTIFLTTQYLEEADRRASDCRPRSRKGRCRRVSDGA